MDEAFKGTYKNLHPFLHTFIIGNSVKLLYGINNNINLSIAIVTYIEIIIFGIICGLIIRKLSKYNVRFEIKLIVFLFYSLFPIFPQITLYIWKDTAFSMFFTLLILEIVDILLENKKYGKEKRGNIYNNWYIGYIIFLVSMVMFMRHNGYYVMLLTIPIALIVLRKNIFRALIMFVLPIILYVIITGPIYTNILNIKKYLYSEGEKYSIPLQAMARIGKYRGEDLTEEERKEITRYIWNYDEAIKNYNPRVSDMVKLYSSYEQLKEDPKGIIVLYFKLLKKYPKEVILSLIEGTDGYYDPESKVTNHVPEGNSTFEIVQAKDWEKMPVIYKRRIVNIPFMTKMYENMYNKENMIISWTTSLGLIMWLIFLIFGYTIYKKEYRYILAFTPIILLWLTCIASPVSGDLRYIYASYTTLPIYLLLPILIRNNKQMLEVEEVEVKEEK